MASKTIRAARKEIKAQLRAQGVNTTRAARRLALAQALKNLAKKGTG